MPFRARFSHLTYSFVDFKNSKYYNLSVDTTHLTFDQAADLILYYKKLAEESHE